MPLRFIALTFWLVTTVTAYAQAVAWQPCSLAVHGSSLAGAQCTQLPLNATQGAHINLLKLAAFSDKQAAPIVIITGGPGTSAVSLAAHYHRWFQKAQKHRDLLFIDQRGTGKSAPFDCDIETGEALNGGTQIQLAKRHERIIECLTPYHQKTGLEGISTIQAAQDIDLVREHLGYEKLQLWGNSYGTRVALAYQQLFPEQVSAVVLDGVAPFDIALPTYAEVDAEQALTQLFNVCDGSVNCPSTFKPLAKQWQDALGHIANRQAEGKPITISVNTPQTPEPYQLELEPALVANWVRFALYNRELSALLPLAIYRAGQGDFEPLANIAKVAGANTATEISAAMHAVILCREDAHVPTQNTPPSSLLPFAKLTDVSPVCKHVDQLVSPAKQLAPSPRTATGAPILLLSGEFDPITPPRWAELAMESLNNPEHWVIPGGHHGVTPQGCVTHLVNQFLLDAAHLDEQEVKKCIDTLKPLAPFIDNAGPALPAATEPAQP